jgi:hypothetical protein
MEPVVTIWITLASLALGFVVGVIASGWSEAHRRRIVLLRAQLEATNLRNRETVLKAARAADPRVSSGVNGTRGV